MNERIKKLMIFLAGAIISFALVRIYDAEMKAVEWRDSQVGMYISPLPDNWEQPEPISEIEIEPEYILKGKASYYSFDGCLGCNENRIMANGEQLDDNKYTVALYPRLFRKYKNQIVTIENLDNGKKINCKVTDSGGFEKYNRIADLSKIAYNFLEVKTDITNLIIY